MITKKWVEKHFISRELHNIHTHEFPAVFKKIEALCNYLGVEIVKEQKAETIVARKIKKAK